MLKFLSLFNSFVTFIAFIARLNLFSDFLADFARGFNDLFGYQRH